MATRDSMNMGSRTYNEIINVKNGISGWRQEASLFNQTLEQSRSILSNVADKFKNMLGGGGPTGGGGSNQVAPNPTFHSTQTGFITDTSGVSVATGPAATIVGNSGFSGAGAGTNLTSYVAAHGGGTLYQPVAGTPSMGGGGGGGGFSGTTSGSSGSANNSNLASNLGLVGKVVGALFAGYNIATDLVPSTADVLEGQLLQQRANYFLGGGKGTGTITGQQNDIARAAMLSGENPQLDVLRAQIAAQSYGLTGGGINKLMMGAANVSNLMPGVGVEGAMRATGAMQQAYNVNMLRGIGIQIRNADGSLKGIDEVINDVWQKICRDFKQSGQGPSPSLQQVQISLQPGNALDSMLNQYFGNDPMLKQLVANGLIYKAQGGGTQTVTVNGVTRLETMKEAVGRLGGTTAAMLQYTTTAAAGQAFITGGASVTGAELGFVRGNEYLQSFYKSMGGALADTTREILSFKGAIDTVLTAFNGNIFSVFASTALTSLGGLISFLQSSLSLSGGTSNPLTSLLSSPSSVLVPAMASGGPVDALTPYLIGEKGPELFIPNSSGTIIPNDKLTASNNTYNFTVNVPNGNSQEVIAAIRNLISELETSKRVSES